MQYVLEMWSGPNVRRVELSRKCDTSSMALCGCSASCLTPAFLPLTPSRLLHILTSPTLLNDGIMSLSPTWFPPRKNYLTQPNPTIFYILTIVVLVLVRQGCHRKWKSIGHAFPDNEIHLETCAPTPAVKMCLQMRRQIGGLRSLTCHIQLPGGRKCKYENISKLIWALNSKLILLELSQTLSFWKHLSVALSYVWLCCLPFLALWAGWWVLPTAG